MKPQPNISIITVNYNGCEDTKELIYSIQEHLITVSYELIVIDNGSRENEAALLLELFPTIQTIRSDLNLGFAGGNNLGIKQATGQYLLFLNNDVILKDASLIFLFETLDKNPHLAGVSPKILFADSPQSIQFAGYTSLSHITLRNCIIGYKQDDNGQWDSPHETPYLHGAAMCIRKEVIETVGLMPEVYFLYYEELDWCTQMTSKGYELGYVPQAEVFHKESRSTGQESPLKVYYMTRNRLLYAKRNRKGGEYILSALYLLIFAYPKSFFYFLSHKKGKQAKAVIKGIIDFFQMKKGL
ncbi:glycosyltransferase family 2 protein [Massilibacteroides sp.]|uniref:glycosyltransferase family 2 protein n=1 Tax=Massilibacteroides sp. TaxID=2034766 RepID=UPI002624EC3B|nr:glycosyltransferase family 2 protein [Massilibacteroides sp.]MDD4514743.1 glycosyltransferase family 2 protein [Massilibacteroides sp.]